MTKVVIHVSQRLNPDWQPSRGDAQHVYVVEKTKNTTQPHLGQQLTETDVEELIAQDFDVNIGYPTAA